jgi:hypothetical protein
MFIFLHFCHFLSSLLAVWESLVDGYMVTFTPLRNSTVLGGERHHSIFSILGLASEYHVL